MVAQQEAIVGENSVVVVGQENNNKNMMMIKGKRTKRPRPLSPLALTMSSTPTTTTDEGGSAMSEEWTAPNSAATSEEEHDMAHCLILLAQGTIQSNSTSNNTTNSNNNNNSGTTLSNKGSMGISSSYECKTCNKSFASFQALGGHRASHKKPKPNAFSALSDLKNSPSSLIFSLMNHDHHHDDGTTLSLQMANSTLCAPTTNTNTNKSKVHECGICGAEFSSGQALGGHMRRHRPIGMTSTTAPSPSENSGTLINAISKSNNNNNNNNVKDVKTTRNHFSLDLNLPAPEDEHPQLQQRDSSSSKFVFSSNEKTLVFAATTSQLVDCHY